MKLASIERIREVNNLTNSDSLDLVKVLGYECIVGRNQYSVGELVVFIQPDTILPEVQWSAMYRKHGTRVRSMKLRNSWSYGIVEKPANVGYVGDVLEGLEISDKIGVSKYDPPAPQDLQAKGLLPYGIPITDEERVQSLETVPYGKNVDVTLKVDGQSWSAYCYKQVDGSWVMGVLGRKLEYKLTANNDYTAQVKRYAIFEKLLPFCQKHDVSLCIRGESYGMVIQYFKINPHSKQAKGLAFFSTYLIKEHRYARKGEPFYIFDLARELELPTVPVLEKDVTLTPELVKKYDEELTNINETPFEGVVLNFSDGTFKIINKYYDSKK